MPRRLHVRHRACPSASLAAARLHPRANAGPKQIISTSATAVVCAVPPVSLIDLHAYASPRASSSVVAIVAVSLLGSDGHAVTSVGMYFAYARAEVCVPPPAAARLPGRVTFVAVPRPFDSPVAAAQRTASTITISRMIPLRPRALQSTAG
jgi:hypothetical protein